MAGQNQLLLGHYAWPMTDDELYNIIEEYGCKLIYLPPYSPDLNPIEKFWANFKRNLRKVIKKFDNFFEAITYAMNITLPC